MGGRGLLLVAGLLKGDPVEEADRAEEARRVLSMHLEDENIEVYIYFCYIPCFMRCMWYCLKAHSCVFKKDIMCCGRLRLIVAPPVHEGIPVS